MIVRLKASFPTFPITKASAQHLYIVDFKKINGGGVQLFSTKPGHDGVYISNPPVLPILFLAFPDNAFVQIAGQGVKHCECVLFPDACNDNDWILFIETKYVDNIENAFKEERRYPGTMIDQIIQTVEVFRAKGIIERDRRVWAIVSFPKLIQDFGAFFFTGQMSIEDMLIHHKIVIKATNSASIISTKRIKLN